MYHSPSNVWRLNRTGDGGFSERLEILYRQKLLSFHFVFFKGLCNIATQLVRMQQNHLHINIWWWRWSINPPEQHPVC